MGTTTDTGQPYSIVLVSTQTHLKNNIMYLKKACLVRLPGNQLALIPLEETKYGLFDFNNRDKNCEILKTTSKVHFWIYRKNVGHDLLGSENHVASPPTEEEQQKIISTNKGVCYIQTDSQGKLDSPSNMEGHRAILIHISIPEYVHATKEMSDGFEHVETDEICPFCEKEKIISGIYLEFNRTGHPCCNTCYGKTGFNEWFNEYKNISKDGPKQLDYSIDMFYRRGLTPKEAIDEMLAVV